MSEFNFKSAICTSREQSKRLLALGLKPETADMMYEGMAEGELPRIMPYKTEMDYFNLWDSITPAWSLHRLWELANIKYIILDSEDEIAVLYDEVIMKIEQFIEEGYFNKDYLEE